jgi:8-oxo-dGTP pyrophosphatase MutT (NUDIX family)
MLSSVLSQLQLPKNILELSSTTYQENLVKNWTGAVCMVCVENTIIYIKRSETMPTHKGQIAFIGGHRNLTEREPTHTALRELEEEIGLKSTCFELIGLLHPVKTSTKSIIVPVLLKSHLSLHEFFKKIVPNTEWDNLFAIKYDHLFSERHWSYAIGEKDRHLSSLLFCALDVKESMVYTDIPKSYVLLWGASARMTWNLLKIASKQGIKVS